MSQYSVNYYGFNVRGRKYLHWEGWRTVRQREGKRERKREEGGRNKERQGERGRTKEEDAGDGRI